MMAYFNKNEFQVSILLSFLTFATICVTLIIVNVNGHCALTKQNVRNDSSSSPKSTGYKVVSRLEWLAQPPGQESILSTPVPYVIILQTATENCSSQAQCVFQVRYIQTCHMESRGWNDIGYNFLIGGDGMVYQGRGWDKEGAHTYGYNAKSIGIAFIGDFIALLPSNDQLKACKVLIQDGISLGYIQNNYTLFGSTQSLMTDSYGNKLYQEIETWPHWKNMSSSSKSTSYKLVSRFEWLAQSPRQESILSTPVPYVIIHHTATENCSSHAQCVFQVRLIQTFHIASRGWNDIGYNFLIGGDGMVYKGRGWDKKGAHTYGYDGKSIGIAFIGTFIVSLPSNKQLQACKELIQEGVTLGYILKNYSLFGAKQLQATASPGDKLYQEIQTWTHWKSNPRK